MPKKHSHTPDELETLIAQLEQVHKGDLETRLKIKTKDPQLKQMVKLMSGFVEGLRSYHESSMELALGVSEIHQVLASVRDGDLSVGVSDAVLSSPDELIAGLGASLNDAVAQIRNNIETISRQHHAIQELSTPVLEIWDGVLTLPIIGVVDTRRSLDLMERLLTAIVEKEATHVILDITGVEVVDTRTADQFIKVIKAAELLGSTCVVSGIRPAVAQTLVELGVDLSAIQTHRNLHAALKACIGSIQERQSGR